MATTIKLTDEEVAEFQKARAYFSKAQMQAMNAAAGFASEELALPTMLVRTASLADTRDQFRDVVSYAEEHKQLLPEHLVTLFQVNQWIGKEAGDLIRGNLTAGLHAVERGYTTQESVDGARHDVGGSLSQVCTRIQMLVDMVKSKLPVAEVIDYERLAKPPEGYIGM
jgi:hypothetical protein